MNLNAHAAAAFGPAGALHVREFVQAYISRKQFHGVGGHKIEYYRAFARSLPSGKSPSCTPAVLQIAIRSMSQTFSTRSKNRGHIAPKLVLLMQTALEVP